MRTPAAEKMSLTDCEISGPIPSPSIRETVKLPYFAWCKPIVFVRSEYSQRARLSEAAGRGRGVGGNAYIGALLAGELGDFVFYGGSESS